MVEGELESLTICYFSEKIRGIRKFRLIPYLPCYIVLDKLAVLKLTSFFKRTPLFSQEIDAMTYRERMGKVNLTSILPMQRARLSWIPCYPLSVAIVLRMWRGMRCPY